MLCSSGGMATAMPPIADAWLLISNISWPVRVRSWKASDSRWACSNMSLRRSSTMLLVELRVDVVVDHGQAVLEAGDDQAGDHRAPPAAGSG